MDGHALPLSYHARLVGDVARMAAYELALRRLVRPGDVVLDLGCGTGILGMLAARRGARVHAIESMNVAGLAEALAAHNRVEVTVHHADARTLPPVERVDLVVSEFMGCFLVDDAMLDAVVAAGRWMKPGARFCPRRVRLYVAPVGDFALPSVDVWPEGFYGLDLSPAMGSALHETLPGNLPASALLAPPALYYTYDPPAEPTPFDAQLSFRFARGGRLRALAGWFEAELADGVTLSTAPGHETHWGQYLFPLPPCDVAAGGALAIRLHLDEIWHWEGAIDGAPFALCATLPK